MERSQRELRMCEACLVGTLSMEEKIPLRWQKESLAPFCHNPVLTISKHAISGRRKLCVRYTEKHCGIRCSANRAKIFGVLEGSCFPHPHEIGFINSDATF